MLFEFTEEEYELLRSAIVFMKYKVESYQSWQSEAFKNERITDADNLRAKLTAQHDNPRKTRKKRETVC